MSKVKRRIGSTVSEVRAPTEVMKYNHGMQAVDRFNQLVALFSLAKAHVFKKYFNKLTMAIFDIAMMNSEIHYFFANKDENRKKNSRYNF
mmetsp:Transcript_17869/g.27351  ORF Transcript_17869/g.27351 Transcript_17869/m.27351 type:complete len:90 (-) Transcript_17869:39-308(-)